AVCCDACNINHIQCMGRVSSSVYQIESALASELTLSGNSRNSRFLLPSSPRFISSTPLCFVSPSQPWNNLSHVVEHPGWVEFCVG
ncbi:Neuromedin-K receptor, partial [Dissostichus eleginoides]